jgi:hypothetical protein
LAVLICVEDSTGALVLNMERGTRCFEGAHAYMMPVAVVMAVGIICVYPLLVYKFTKRVLSSLVTGSDPYGIFAVPGDEVEMNADRRAMALFFCKNYRSHKERYRMLPYLVRIVLTLQVVATKSAVAASAAMSFVFSLEILILLMGMPFDNRKHYVRTFGLRIALFAFQFIWLVALQSNEDFDAAIFSLTIIASFFFIAVMSILLFKLQIHKACLAACRKFDEQEKQRRQVVKARGGISRQDLFARIEQLEREAREAVHLRPVGAADQVYEMHKLAPELEEGGTATPLEAPAAALEATDRDVQQHTPILGAAMHIEGDLEDVVVLHSVTEQDGDENDWQELPASKT